MAIPAWRASRCDVATGEDRFIAQAAWPLSAYGNIAIQLSENPPPIYIAALNVYTDVSYLKESNEIVQVIDSGETDCAKAKAKYGL